MVACSALKQRYRDILTGRESGSNLAEDIAFVSTCMRCRAEQSKPGGSDKPALSALPQSALLVQCVGRSCLLHRLQQRWHWQCIFLLH